PEEALDLETALAAYTSGSAWQNRQDEAGPITPGALADIAVFNQNPFDVDVADLHTTSTDLTLVDGRPVFSHDRQGASA
ncbi:amidohydrolase family protein, partial [Salmonella enterica]|uniref:amidohydrolase family protein n=1 Tax=Salmonella enterica TaxID=28901 RepID=UPI0015C89AE7